MHGACLCGSVQFEAEPLDRHSHACHCAMCRRWTGAAFIVVPVQPDTLRWTGEEHIRRYQSSDWAERGWCDRCGSALFYRVTAAGPNEGYTMLALGLFDAPDGMPLATEIYIDSKPGAYALAGEHPRLTGKEFEASLAAASP